MPGEQGPGRGSAAEPPPADAVRSRLLQLIRDLQPGSTGAASPTGARYAIEGSSGADGEWGTPGADRVRPEAEQAGEESPLEGEEWLERLRHPPAPDAETAVAGELRPWLRQAGVRALSFGREHLAAVVIVLLVGVAWSAYSLLQAHSSPVATAAPVVQTSPAAVPSPAVSSAPPAEILVHVIGAVRKPGVVRLAEGSRVADAIAAAGGLVEAAAPGELNLAQVVSDGVQLKIGTRQHPGGWIRGSTGTPSGGAGGAGGAAAGESTKVALNSATLQQLDTLPGVGPVTAQKIIDWRTQHGKFSSISELQEVAGIGPKTYADIEPHVRL